MTAPVNINNTRFSFTVVLYSSNLIQKFIIFKSILEINEKHSPCQGKIEQPTQPIADFTPALRLVKF